MADQWGPWIEHDGRGCPDVVGLMLEVKVARDADLPPAEAGDCDSSFSRPWLWALMPWPYRVVAYRIRKPRGMVVLESLLADLPERVGA